MSGIYIVIIITLLFSAFFSGMEIAYLSSNKLRLELDKNKNTFLAKALSVFSENPGQYIVTMLIGNNIALVIYGIFMAIVLEPFVRSFTHTETWVLIIQTSISTLIILVMAEFIPKALFRTIPNSFLNFFSLPVAIFYYLFYPVAQFTIALSNGFLRLFFHIKDVNKPVNQVFGKSDLARLLDESQMEKALREEQDHSLRIFQNALDFSKVKLRECMIPRTEIVALDKHASIEQIRETFIETGHSKLLIYDESIDNIIGYVNIKDFFTDPESIDMVLHTLIIAPESMPANKLLSLFVEQKKNIALVVDEFGGTSGIVTIEDILEEIFGEIEDEHDTSLLTEKRTGPDEYVFSGRLETDYLNEKYNLDIPEKDDYETLAGFILYHYGSLPKSNQKLIIESFEIQILKTTETRIDLVRLKKIRES
ncbi:MAG TPA: HlyC/CorC family transporter [Bacteroidetes bacterium]|nr:HlyC/CorC family transporter [Bacteroidota bacterium]